MSNFGQFVRSYIPVTSTPYEPPEDMHQVFVPECGGRWGLPSNFAFLNGANEEHESPAPPSISVDEHDEDIIRYGHEVDHPVNDADGNQVATGWEYVCYCGFNERRFIESEQNGSATVKHWVTEITYIYVDAKPIAKYASNYATPMHSASQHAER